MRRLSFIVLLSFLASLAQAQTIHCDIDSVNNEILLTSDFMSYCTQGVKHTKSDERHSLSLNYYSNKSDSYYILCLPLVTDEVQTVKKGNKLKFVMQNADTVIMKCSTDFTSKDMFHEGDNAYWVVLPKYHCTEKTLRQLLNGRTLAIHQELPDGKTIKLVGESFYRWRFTKTLTELFKEINKAKPEKTGTDLLYKDGQYNYLQNDTVVKTNKKITFSDKWMY